MFLNKLKNNKYIKLIILGLMSIITTISLTLDINSVDKIIDIDTPTKVGTLGLLIIGIAIFLFFKSFYFKGKKNIVWFNILSILFSIFMVVGNSYNQINSWDFIFGSIPLFLISIVMLLGFYFLFYRGIYFIYEFVNNNSFIQTHAKNNKILNYIFVEHPFISTFIILLICWLPYIIAFYPGILSPDPSNQIKQFFGLDTQYREYVIMLDESVGITNHHPVMHTLLLGGCVKLGMMLGSANFGIFIFSMIQITLLISVLACTICYMKKLNTPFWLRILTLSIYAFIPVFPFYSMSLVKDVMFSIFVMFYIMLLFDLIKFSKEKYSIKKMIILIILMLLIMLCRNNGIYLIVMSFPFLLFIDKKNRWRILGVLIIPILIFEGYNKILLPAFKVTPGSIREMLSISFQQTARYVKEYNDEVTYDEKQAIDKILGYDTLASRYEPEKSDAVKNEYNKYATDEDLKEYFRVWFKQFLKHPTVYLEATINNTYGYFYPDAKNWYFYYKYDKRLEEAGIDYHYNSLKPVRTVLSSYGEVIPYIPVIGNVVNIASSVWICMIIFVFLIYKKMYKYLIYLTPVISLVLVCIASPVNTYFRYAMPYVFSIPIIIAMFLNIMNDKDRSIEK